MHSFLSFRRPTAALLALLASAAIAQPPRPVWGYVIAPAVQGEEPVSGLLFEFERPCAATAFVTADGFYDGKSFHLSAELPTSDPQRNGNHLLKFPDDRPLEDSAKLEVSSIAVECGGYRVTVPNAKTGMSYAYCENQ